MRHSPNNARLYALLCTLVVVLGIFFRLWVFNSHESFWKDEAGLARNFLTHDFAHIADPFGDGQAIPIGYAQICKGFEHLLGHNEHAFWSVSLIAGSVLLGLSAILFGAILPAGAALIALGALAFDTTLIQYSVEFKAYMMDSLAALLMARAFFNYQTKGAHRNAVYLLSGVISLWISYVSVFIIAGLGLWQLWEAFNSHPLPTPSGRGRNTGSKDPVPLGGLRIIMARLCARPFLRVLWVNTALASVFAVLWALNYRFLDARGFFSGFWKDHFVPLPWQPGFIDWWTNTLPGIIGWLFGQEQFLIWIFFVVLGLYRAWEINRRLLALTFPILLTLIAGALHLYPVYDRLVLFWAVLLTPFLALGLFHVWEVFNKQYRTITLAFALILVLPFLHPLHRLSHSHDSQQLKQVCMAVSRAARPGDTIYVHNRAAELYKYYFHRYPPVKGVKLVFGQKAETLSLAPYLEKHFKGRHLYFMYTEPCYQPDEIDYLGRYTQARGELKRDLDMNLAGAFELQLH
jgi:hypothetical protein